jgi:hypothetical protein
VLAGVAELDRLGPRQPVASDRHARAAFVMETQMAKDNPGMGSDNCDVPREELGGPTDLGREMVGREGESRAAAVSQIPSPAVSPLPSSPGAVEFELNDDGIDDGGWLCI